MITNSPQQLLPGFSFANDAGFDSFYAPASMRLIKATLRRAVDELSPDCIYISGSDGCGKSHLLQAVCNAATEQGKTALYLPLAELHDYKPQDVLENMASLDMLCLDDVDAIAGSPDWQEAVFHLYNQRFSAQKPLFFAARQPARSLALTLPDLQSRLASCLAFQIPELNDEEKTGLLVHLAALRGMAMNDACARYIIQRLDRSIPELMQMLEKLDQASLVAGRRITVPFIRETLHVD